MKQPIRFFTAFALTLLVATGAAADWRAFRGDSALTGVATSELPAELEPLWSFATGDIIESTAAIADGVVYVGSLDGNLYALDLDTGEKRWTYATGEEIKSSPLVAAGSVFFGDEGGVFHAVDAATGEARWTFETDGGVTSSANIEGDRVLFGSYDNFLYSLTLDGELVWKVETESYVHATPAIHDGHTFVAGCDGYLRRVRLSDGGEADKLELQGYVAGSTAIAGGRAFVGTFENEVLGIDLGAPRVIWRYSPEREFPFYSSPAVTAERVVIGGRDKSVHALAPATGERLWTFATPARVDASPVVVGDRVFVGSLSGTLYALALDDGEELWSFETGAAILASAAVSDGKLVIGTDDGTVYAFGTTESSP